MNNPSLGIYPIQLACWVFDHEKPLKITASGHLMPSGVDENCSITLLFSDQRIAQINISTNCYRFDQAFLVGEKGIIEVNSFHRFFMLLPVRDEFLILRNKKINLEL